MNIKKTIKNIANEILNDNLTFAEINERLNYLARIAKKKSN